ncbi:SDR family NAD(P)-dependent oxidoreductase [Corynebacterium felinum]|uniref:NAD(P)-dependent dehydrogenase (Short-subunit alcohol dehydrogenase family) n=1 Tax=Corynebacterium felinum TaxID=131318 RepID=A0ABU2BAN7_9CORY|nr:SDR family NAD(P)-dependent oxidoreductase [Corynebacterium felinum]MDF5820022.1 SDR family NAD(P)-dependent oxidoreductase [Corynebacterium felinum]MDR7355681.1 NAD(P)-dependent dehydrogenase (short-subunit alcohol dehydrogenase family) [Corynebacterium felinum]WJY95032.1 3-ketoacyl-(acyl-carrier-protein) reductase [Corynebacterium felinum]
MNKDLEIPEEDFRITLRVLEQVGDFPSDHLQSRQLQQAVAKLFKAVKKQRRQAAKQRRQTNDASVLARTATANPQRIDDETAGLVPTPAALTPPTSAHLDSGQSALGNTHARIAAEVATPHGWAGKLYRANKCYICKQPYTLVDSFHHQLCPDCAADNRARREARVDLSGRRALLTGGRAKIGMYIALKLLRDGADVTITTRFPKDAVRRFCAVADSDAWLDRLHVVGIDLRDPNQVEDLAERMSAQPLDILINNAAQTVRRLPGAYSGLIDAETAPLTAAESSVDCVSLGATSTLHPAVLVGGDAQALGEAAPRPVVDADAVSAQIHAARLAALALTGGSAALERVADGTAVDAGGLIPDQVEHNSWVATIGEVDPLELLEVQLCNATAPFILLNRLRPALEASKARRKYVVNVSAMEGVFHRGYKGPGHPHTNMAKAALNMLTRTSSAELFEHGILMTSVDTGWITDERPHTLKQQMASQGFHAPLDLVDGAARVYDPIVQGENGVDLYGCFLKDFRPHPW